MFHVASGMSAMRFEPFNLDYEQTRRHPTLVEMTFIQWKKAWFAKSKSWRTAGSRERAVDRYAPPRDNLGQVYNAQKLSMGSPSELVVAGHAKDQNINSEWASNRDLLKEKFWGSLREFGNTARMIP